MCFFIETVAIAEGIFQIRLCIHGSATLKDSLQSARLRKGRGDTSGSPLFATFGDGKRKLEIAAAFVVYFNILAQLQELFTFISAVSNHGRIFRSDAC
jgi:hypothetical protein